MNKKDSLVPENSLMPEVCNHLKINTYAYETHPLIKMTGFREYDARWLFGQELNLMGTQVLGLALGTLIHEMGVRPDLVTGHDYRSYSQSIKLALITGLMGAGIRVHDIGLCLSPMAYFAQFELDAPAVAMVTASHNDNGWTGIKMGTERPITFGPDEMQRLRDIVLQGRYKYAAGGEYRFINNFAQVYLDDLKKNGKIKRRLKVVAACGNGTAGAFACDFLEAIGCEVVPLDCELNWNFPRYNPNPEDMNMLHAMADKVCQTHADLALGFDGDGDRCGVVDELGHEIFADKIGVMLARDLSVLYPGATFVADVKSTGLFSTDPELVSRNVKVDYWKTGHSYIKRRVHELNALAGFEKSGHFFFNHPVGRGYDDGFLTAVHVLQMLERNPSKSLSQLYKDLPHTYGSPTMSPHCDDEKKYEVIEKVTKYFQQLKDAGKKIAGHTIVDLLTINGVRVSTDDGTWGLIRASSNKPELVVVVESPISRERLEEMFKALDEVLRQNPGIGAYNQTF